MQIIQNLLLACCVVALAAPDFQLDDIAPAQVVDDHVHPPLVAGLFFNAVGAGAVDDGGEVGQEAFPAFFLQKLG